MRPANCLHMLHTSARASAKAPGWRATSWVAFLALTSVTFLLPPTSASATDYTVVVDGVLQTYDPNMTCRARYERCLEVAPKARASCEAGYRVAQQTGRYPAPRYGKNFAFVCKR